METDRRELRQHVKSYNRMLGRKIREASSEEELKELLLMKYRIQVVQSNTIKLPSTKVVLQEGYKLIDRLRESD